MHWYKVVITSRVVNYDNIIAEEKIENKMKSLSRVGGTSMIYVIILLCE